jgi:hypothetical protein
LAGWKLTDIDQRYRELIDPHHPKVEFEKRAEADNQRLYGLLRKSGATRRCHVISAWSDLDGQEVDLRRAITRSSACARERSSRVFRDASSFSRHTSSASYCGEPPPPLDSE